MLGAAAARVKRDGVSSGREMWRPVPTWCRAASLCRRRTARALGFMVAAATLLAACGSGAALAPPAGLRLVGDFPLDGGSTRFDYESLDASTNRLVIAHLGDGKVTIVDTR